MSRLLLLLAVLQWRLAFCSQRHEKLKVLERTHEIGMTRDQQKKSLVSLYASSHGWESTLKVQYSKVAVNCSLLMLYHTSRC